MTQTLFYILPLILGRTIDLNKMQVGVDIFPQGAIQKPIRIQNPITETRYKIVDNTQEARDLLDVSGSVSLNVKSGLVKGGVAGAYLTDVYNRENTVEILVRATYETVTETLPTNARPVNTWKSMSGLGTHYVKSITYGGELVASVRLISNNTRNKKDIKGALEAGGQFEGIDLGIEVEGGYLSDVSKSVETTQIKVHSSIPVSRIPHNIKELEAMLERFPNDIKDYNNGAGVPIKVELMPLDHLDSSRQRFLQNKVLEAHLDTFEQKFDDILNTKAAISDWMKAITEELTEEQEKKVGEFYAEVSDVLRKFHQVVGDLDMSAGTSQLDPALKAYGTGLPGMWYKRYVRLRESIIHDQGEWSRKGSGAIYMHWGKRNCTGKAESFASGYVVGPESSGANSNFLCLKEISNLPGKTSKDSAVRLTPVSYRTPSGKSYSLPCSACRLQSAGSVRTFSGLYNCPGDWNFVYRGFLLGGDGKTKNSDFVCLDEQAQSSSVSSSIHRLLPSWVPKTVKNEQQQMVLPCVVCSL